MASLKEQLTDIIIKNKIITQEQLNHALAVQKEKGGRLSDIIIGLKFIKESELVSALSTGLGLPLIDLKRLKIDPEVLKLISVDNARNFQIIPISKIGDTITLAMADPLNIFTIDHVKTLTGYKINPIISTSHDILQTIESVYPDTSKGAIDNLVQEMSSSTLELIKEEKEAAPSDQELSRVSRETPVIKITNMILEDGVKRKASDILVEPQEKKLRVRFRIDGILQETQAPPKSMHPSIISRIKVISDLNIAEHRLPQDGRFKVKILGREVDFRVSIIPSNLGEKAAIRILDKSSATLDIEKLGFNAKMVERLKKTCTMPHGMLLVSGPTGSGKTTTLYSALKLLDKPEKNIVTVEDPVEFQLEGINQVTVKTEIGLTFASALRSILRQDPNIIMIGEIRDFDTVDIAIKSALTGHLVLSTLHTTTASGAIVRLVNMGVEPYLINSSLVCVMAQRLVRKICYYCKEKYALKKEIVESLKLKFDSLTSFSSRIKDDSGGHVKFSLSKFPDFYRGKGCPHCFNTGYSGRIGIAEVLVITQKIRELILARSQEHLIKEQARKEGMETLREDGIWAAIEGLTTLEEVLRVTAPDE